VVRVQQVESPVGFVCDLQVGHSVELFLGNLLSVETVVRKRWQIGFRFADVAGVVRVEVLEGLGDFVDVSLVVRRAAHADALVGAQGARAVNPEPGADPRVRAAVDVAEAHLVQLGRVAPGLAVAASAVAAGVWHGDVDVRRHVGDPDASALHAALLAATSGGKAVAALAHAAVGAALQVPLSDVSSVGCSDQSRQVYDVVMHGRSGLGVRGNVPLSPGLRSWRVPFFQVFAVLMRNTYNCWLNSVNGKLKGKTPHSMKSSSTRHRAEHLNGKRLRRKASPCSTSMMLSWTGS